MHAIVTGGAGFIGGHLIDRLIKKGWYVTAIDNFDDFYGRDIKEANISRHFNDTKFRLITENITDTGSLRRILDDKYEIIFHLAGKTGVSDSIKFPEEYFEVNGNGTKSMLKIAREKGIDQFIFASSSSVYGNCGDRKFKEDSPLCPLNSYAASKIVAEGYVREYSRLYGIRSVVLRLFSVYGPKQRPDLVIRKFAEKIMKNEQLDVYNHGRSLRDYTFIDDVVDSFELAMSYMQHCKFEIINIGNSKPYTLNSIISKLEHILEEKANIRYRPHNSIEARRTFSDINKARDLLRFQPKVSINEGLEMVIDSLKTGPCLNKSYNTCA
jgi:UDP-glucuronate 4-epimerase